MLMTDFYLLLMVNTCIIQVYVIVLLLIVGMKFVQVMFATIHRCKTCEIIVTICVIVLLLNLLHYSILKTLIHFPPQEFLLGDCTKAKTDLKWQPNYSFDVSMEVNTCKC